MVPRGERNAPLAIRPPPSTTGAPANSEVTVGLTCRHFSEERRERCARRDRWPLVRGADRLGRCSAAPVRARAGSRAADGQPLGARSRSAHFGGLGIGPTVRRGLMVKSPTAVADSSARSRPAHADRPTPWPCRSEAAEATALARAVDFGAQNRSRWAPRQPQRQIGGKRRAARTERNLPRVDVLVRWPVPGARVDEIVGVAMATRLRDHGAPSDVAAAIGAPSTTAAPEKRVRAASASGRRWPPRSTRTSAR